MHVHIIRLKYNIHICTLRLIHFFAEKPNRPDWIAALDGSPLHGLKHTIKILLDDEKDNLIRSIKTIWSNINHGIRNIYSKL